MPGVVVTTAVRSGPSGDGDIESGQFFVVGETERGPTVDATLIRSFSEYTATYGGYVSGNLWTHVKAYFEEGGSRCYVGRVVGAGASAGTLDLDDNLAAPTMTITAANVGAWSANLSVEVQVPDVAGFKIQITLDGEILLTTRDLVDVADAVSVINTSSVSHLIVASDNAGSSLVPDTLASASLSTGSNGTMGGSQAEHIAGLAALFDYDMGAGAVAAPGETGTAIWVGLRDHAAARNRIALLAFGATDSAATAKSAASAYYSDTKAKYMAFYYPYIKVTDSSGNSGLTTNVSPEAYAAASRTKAIQSAGGPWRAGAGLISAATGYVQDVVTSLDKAAGDLLDEARVNALRVIGGSVRIYGARSVSNDEVNWRYITFQDSINYMVVEAENRLEDFVFSSIDSRGGLFNRIEASLVGMLDPIRISGGLYEAYNNSGERIDPGYSVVVNNDINPVSQLAQGKVNAQVGVRVSSVGDQIQITITKSNLTASVV